jgi:hypothetical protein
MRYLARSLCGYLLFFFFSFDEGLAQSPSNSETYREAYDRGYQDGLQSGREDKGKDPFDFANKKVFQSAEQGFDQSRHDREVYRVAYRRGFEDGYGQGYGLVNQESPFSSIPTPRTKGTLSSFDPQEATSKIPAGTRIKLRLLDSLSTRHNERGDSFQAEVVNHVMVQDRILIPAGTLVNGVIANLERAGRIKGRASMNFRFANLEFAGGTKVPIRARIISIEEQESQEIKDEEGTVQAEGTKSEDARRVGAASGIGALIGVLTGGKRGAKTGAVIGTVAGLAGVLTSRGRDLQLDSRAELMVELDREVEVPHRVLESDSP